VIWNDDHDIRIRGHEVELYAQNAGAPIHSAGIYSVLQGRWIRKPDPVRPDLDLGLVRIKAQWMMDLIDDAMESPHRLPELERLKDKVKRMRETGLKREGEFSVENQAFKVLRRSGYLTKLWNTYGRDLDASLSLEMIFR